MAYKIKRLNQVKKSPIPDTFIFKNKKFRMIHYSKEGGFGQNKQRSKEIIWESKDGSEIYLYGEDISYLK